MLFVLSAAKLIFEVALLSLMGQWFLGLIAGPQRENNGVYQILQRVSHPFVRMVPWVTPKQVEPRHYPWVAFLLLLLAWVTVTAAKVSHCVQIGLALCR